MNRKIIAIIGPTASGKTGVGVRLAKEFNGEIISADSRQVYRGLDLGTGKEGVPCKELSITKDQLSSNYQLKNDQLNGKCKLIIEKLRLHRRCIDSVPQWMIDIVEPGEKMTLFDYLPQARAAIEDIFSRGKVPIIVGGTGLYIQGIIEGFVLDKSKIKNQKSKFMNNYSREQLEKTSVKELNDILREIDIEKYEKVDKKNKHRLIRAIELAQEGLRSIKIKPDFEVLQIGIEIPRTELHERIDRRVDERFGQGMGQEVFNLLQKGVSPEWLISLGLEYRIITEYLLGIANGQLPITNQTSNSKFQSLNKLEIDNLDIGKLNENWSSTLRDEPSGSDSNEKLINDKSTLAFQEMSQKLKWRIHQFARRQLTWFRRFPEIEWLRDYDQIKRFAKIFLEH